MKLPHSFVVKAGQLYSVVIQLPTGKQHGTYFDSAGYGKGVSFRALYNSEGLLKWNDCYDLDLGDVCIHVYTEYESETAQILRSDMDRDGRLTSVDLSLMKQAIRQPERSDLYQSAADWNEDNAINVEDAAKRLLGFLLGIPDQE